MRSTFLQKNCPAIVYGHRRICTLMQCDYCSYSIAQVHTKHTNTYIQISILRKTNTSTCSHTVACTHMHVLASKTYTCIYTHYDGHTRSTKNIPNYIYISYVAVFHWILSVLDIYYVQSIEPTHIHDRTVFRRILLTLYVSLYHNYINKPAAGDLWKSWQQLLSHSILTILTHAHIKLPILFT